MSARRKYRRGLLLIISITAIGAATLLSILLTRPQIAVLPDGSSLQLVGSTYGTTHILRAYPPHLIWWRRLLAPRTLLATHTKHPALILWLELSLRHPIPSGVGLSEPWDFLRIRNELGDQIVSSYSSCQSDILPTTNGGTDDSPESSDIDDNEKSFGSFHQLWALPLNLFPRRGRRVIVSLYQYGRKLPIATFYTANPVQRPFAVWRPGSLPQTSSGPLQFTIKSIGRKAEFTRYTASPSHYITLSNAYINNISDSEIDARHLPASIHPGDSFNTDIDYSVRYRGRLTSAWSLFSYTLADPTGNECWGVITKSYPELSAYHASSEKALRLTIGLRHSIHSASVTGPVWKLKGVRMPAKNQFNPIDTSFALSGFHITLEGVCGQDRLYYGKNKTPAYRITYFSSGSIHLSFPSSSPNLRVHITPRMPDGARLLLKVQNQNGMPAKEYLVRTLSAPHLWIAASEPDSKPIAILFNGGAGSGEFSNDPKSQIGTYFFVPPPGTKRLNLTFQLDMPRYASFTIPVR